jgi:hypothetical protein
VILLMNLATKLGGIFTPYLLDEIF